jgi:hypothetical protein
MFYLRSHAEPLEKRPSHVSRRLRQAVPRRRGCAHHLFEKRWPNGFICPNCQSAKAWALDSKTFTYQRNKVTKPVLRFSIGSPVSEP